MVVTRSGFNSQFGPQFKRSLFRGRSARRTMGSAFRAMRSRYSARVASRAGAAVAGRAAAGGLAAAGAVGAGVAGLGYGAYRVYDYVKKRNARQRAMKKPAAKRTRWHTTGGYGGRVKVRRRGVATQWDKFNKNGVVYVNEVIGNMSDPNSVYLMNEVVNCRDLIFYLCCAMLRKLLEKAGMRVTGFDDAVFSPNAGNVSSTGYLIRLVKINNLTGVQVTSDFTILAATTFGSLCANYRNEFEQYATGHGELSNANMDELYKFIVLFGNSESQDMRAEMLFNETFMTFTGKSEMKVQNRTKATGGSEDAENVNNNPLTGKTYLFKGVPKPKANGYVVGGANGALYPFERLVYNEAIQKFGGGTAGFDANMKEPPNPKLFWNCYKAGKIHLEPGQVKSFVISETHSGNVLKLLKKFRLQLDGSGIVTTYSAFKVQMIALEDLINVNAAENISVQFELERTLGVMCYTRQKKYYKSQYLLSVPA